MSEHVTVELIDQGTAVREALDESASSSRATFLSKAVVAGGTLAVGGVLISGLPGLASAAPSAAHDADILNFALTLEYLEAAFYNEAIASGKLKGETLALAKTIAKHENAHVAFLKSALGSKAVKKPTFDFQGTTKSQSKFQATSVVLEDTGVSAYNGQGPNLTKKTLGAAAQIVSVEARHAAWIRNLLQMPPAPAAFDPSLTKAKVLAAVTKTGFIKS
jgi:hypothetical protein